MEHVVGIPTTEAVDSFLQELAAIGEHHGSIVQAFDPRYCAGLHHLETALDYARRAHKRGEGIADDLAMEVLLYAAGTRQIEQALTIGMQSPDEPVLIICGEGNEQCAHTEARKLLDTGEATWTPNDALIMNWFDITEEEREATTVSLEALVVERVALLEIAK